MSKKDIKTLIYFNIDVFYFNQLLHNLSNQLFNNLILIRFKRIEVNYLYVLSNKFHFINHMKFSLHFTVK